MTTRLLRAFGISYLPNRLHPNLAFARVSVLGHLDEETIGTGSHTENSIGLINKSTICSGLRRNLIDGSATSDRSEMNKVPPRPAIARLPFSSGFAPALACQETLHFLTPLTWHVGNLLMDRDTELALLDRIQAHRKAGRGTDTASSAWQQHVSAYISPDRLNAERKLLTYVPTVVGLSGLLPDAGTYATTMLGDAPIVLTRNQDGKFAAMLNVCRHRGAEVATGCGSAALLSCPYHGWTYRLDGSLAARRRPEHFGELEENGLVQLPALEQDGLLWVSGTPDTEIPAQPLQGAQADLAGFDLGGHRLFTSTTFTRPINWKLVIDTFLEVYHVPVLHEQTLGGLIYGDYSLFDGYNEHGRMIVTRTSIGDLDDQARDDWQFLQHSTIVWALQPSTILIYQQDHAQLYQARPGAHAGESIITVSIYVPQETTIDDSHWQKNFDLLVQVTDTEDFVTCAGIQRGFASGAQDVVTFGANEPLLAHYERNLNRLVENASER
jgi:nitrite reductase/ring-hydroxylating ferredoxin subunit